MQLIESLEKITPFDKAVITIGNFDGVHIGHQALFHTVIEQADAIGGVSVAMTFEPHPIRVLTQNNHFPLITLFEQKKELIESSGIDALLCIPFTKEFAQITAEQFVSELLVKKIGMRAIVVGNDYTFGKGREGDITFLQDRAGELSYQVIVTDWIQDNGEDPNRISSTRIRELVRTGQMTQARKMLGRWYQIRGKVTPGRNRGGKLLGFPTANINLQDELAPKNGVYAVWVEVDGNRQMGVANIGYSPTFDDHVFTVEVHLLDFDGDLYGKQIRVSFVNRIRGEIKFDSLDALSAKIRDDIRVGKKLLRGT